MTEEQAKEMIDLLQAILEELRQNKTPKIGVVEGSSTKPPIQTVDETPLRG